jgi:hypothetical protein
MGKNDKLVSVKPMLERIADWEAYLSNIDIGGNTNMIEQHTRTRRLSRSGMPLLLTTRQTLGRKEV